MRSGLHKQLSLLAVLPALIVASGLGVASGWQGLNSVRQSARTTARLKARYLAATIDTANTNEIPTLDRSRSSMSLIQARVFDASGHVLYLKHGASQPPLPALSPERWLGLVGRFFIGTRVLQSTATSPKAPELKVTVELTRRPWFIAAGRSVALAAAVAAAALVLALLAGTLLSSRLTRELRRITRQLTRLTQGKYDSRIPASPNTELGRIASDLNLLADILARRSEIPGASADPNPGKNKAARSKAMSRKLESRLHALDHELRTPLNAINGYVQLLSKEHLSASQMENLAVINGGIRTLTQLLDDMLPETDGKKRDHKKKLQSFDLVALIDEVIRLAAPAAYAKGIDIIADCGGWRSLPVSGHELHLRQILTNLVGNGVKYTSEGHVCLQLVVGSTGGDKLDLVLHVSDTGPGIPVKHRARVFQPNERLRATSAIPGKGLGLALSQQLAKNMGGHISLEEAQGGGCRFSLHLAMSHAESFFVASPAPASAPMLLWEPNPTVRTALAHRLGATGGELEFAPNCEALLKRLAEKPELLGILGLAPGETPPTMNKSLPQLRVLACSIEPPRQDGLAMAPKSISQQRLESLLGLHHKRTDKKAQSYLSPRLWRILCEDMPVDLDRLARALRTNDLEDARAAVHRICGTTSFVRMHESEQAARKLESLLKTSDVSAPMAWKQLKGLSHTILRELRRIAPPVTRRSLASWRIMVVDDNRLNAELLARHLESHGAIVDQFCSAREARSATGPWHAILVDVQLDDENGIQLGQELQRKFGNTLLVAQSGDVQASTRSSATESGFHDYLTKPIDLDHLPQRLLALRAAVNQASQHT